MGFELIEERGSKNIIHGKFHDFKKKFTKESGFKNQKILNFFSLRFQGKIVKMITKLY